MKAALHRALIPVIALLLTGQAVAEDLTGFYAGINAGCAMGRARGSRSGGNAAGGSEDRDRSGTDLPPSAAGVAGNLRRTGRAAGVPSAL